MNPRSLLPPINALGQNSIQLTPNSPVNIMQGSADANGNTAIDFNPAAGVVNTAEDLLPTAGAVVGGIAGGALGGGIGAVPGAGAGAALGESLREALKGKKLSPTNIAVQGALGLAGEGAGQLVGKVAGGALSKLAEAEASKGVNATAKMANDYAQSHGGTTILDVLRNNNILGGGAEEISNAAKPIQDQFDTIATSPKPINQDIFLNRAIGKLQDLQNSTVPSVNKLGNQVDDALANVVNKAGKNGQLTIEELNNARKEYDAATKNSQWGSDQWGVNRIVGDILRKTVQDSADETGLVGSNGESLTQLGQKLNQLYDLHDIAMARQGVGKGGTLTNLARAGTAAFISSVLGFNPLAGMAAEEVGSRLADNPAIASVIAKGGMKAGNILSGVGATAAGGLGAAGATGLGSALLPSMSANGSEIQSAQQPNNSSPNNASHTNSNLPQGVTTDNSGNINLPPLQANGVQQDYPYEKYIADLQKAGNNTHAQEMVQRAYDASQSRANSYISANALSADEQSQMRNAYNDNYLMNRVRQQLAQTPPSVLNRIKSINDLKMLGGNYAQLATDLQTLQADVGKQLQGGVLRGYDVTVLNTAPALTDSPEAAMAKLNQLQLLMTQNYMNLYPRYGLNTQSPTANSPMPQLGQ